MYYVTKDGDGDGVLQMSDILASAVLEDYEGIVLRNPDGIYEWGYRSHTLMKVKEFVSEEFEVISIQDGIGKMEGRAIVRCKNNINDLEFDVVPKASMDVRKEVYENQEKYVGAMYTVQFFERSLDGLPRFPVGLCFRPLEDLPVL